MTIEARTNADRAEAAQYALEWYADRLRVDLAVIGYEAGVRHLFTDLLHFCAQQGIDYGACHALAFQQFKQEEDADE